MIDTGLATQESKNGFLRASDGGKSSKRLWGTILCSIACIMAVVLFVFSLYKPVVDSRTAFDVMITTLTAGCGLLGFTLLENFKFGAQK